MRRLVILVSALLLVLATGVSPGVVRAAAPPVPKVAVIVGPVGGLTHSYITLANQAAKAATAAGAQVVMAYSPDATWPAVKAATEGASIVVYLGHGNGFPSRYRDTLFPPTENGFGLNPVAGEDDGAHQYFGEAYVGDLHLAHNAVVVLSHLCYASGNSEPGLAQGTTDEAIQRVDNYAAGFLRAGARAVVAEGHLGPAYYVRSLLTSRLSIEQIWGRSPAAHGNTFSVPSSRSAGFTERLDPDRVGAGYYRSLVSAGLDAPAVRAGAAGVAGAATARVPDQPSLANLHLMIGTLALGASPIAGTNTNLTLPLPKAAVAKLPKGVLVGVRWDPILPDAPPSAPPGGPPDAPASGGAAGSPGASPAPVGPVASTPPLTSDPDATPKPGPMPAAAGPASGPATTGPATAGPATTGGPSVPAPLPAASPVAPPPDPGDGAGLPDAPAVELVVPEQQGTLVTPAKAKYTSKGLSLAVALPAAPGLYRLVTTLHTSSGVAFDAATQALLTPMLVRVGGPVAVAYGVAPSVSVSADTSTELPVRVRNTGRERLDRTLALPRTAPEGKRVSSDRPVVMLPSLVATWVSATRQDVPAPAVAVLAPEAATPGGETTVRLRLVGPSDPGEYLLLLDVVSPSQGSLSARGSAPALVRVSVGPSAAAGAPDAGASVLGGPDSPR